ncbi:unnamed protein product [Laminaria digitata]
MANKIITKPHAAHRQFQSGRESAPPPGILAGDAVVERETDGRECTLSCLGVAWWSSDERSASGSLVGLHPIGCAKSYEIVRAVIVCK